MASLWLDSFYGSALYKVHIMSPIHGDVTGYLTSDVSLTTNAQWSAMTDQADVASSTAGKAFSVMVGKTALINLFTYQAYQGSEPIDMNFTFTFVATTDALTEVVQPCTTLGKFPLSATANGTLLEPPAYKDKWCSIKTNYMQIVDWLVPVSCTITYSSTLSKAGYPIKGEAAMGFKTKKAITAPDWKGWFPGS